MSVQPGLIRGGPLHSIRVFALVFFGKNRRNPRGNASKDLTLVNRYVYGMRP
jgi:hypothetical protein